MSDSTVRGTWRPHHFMRAFDSFGRVMGLCRRCGKSKEARRHV